MSSSSARSRSIWRSRSKYRSLLRRRVHIIDLSLLPAPPFTPILFLCSRCAARRLAMLARAAGALSLVHDRGDRADHAVETGGFLGETLASGGRDLVEARAAAVARFTPFGLDPAVH